MYNGKRKRNRDVGGQRAAGEKSKGGRRRTGAGSLQRRTSSPFRFTVSAFVLYQEQWNAISDRGWSSKGKRWRARGGGRDEETRGVPSVSSSRAKSLVQQWELPFYQSAPVAILLNTPESIINSLVMFPLSLPSGISHSRISHDKMRG